MWYLAAYQLVYQQRIQQDFLLINRRLILLASPLVSLLKTPADNQLASLLVYLLHFHRTYLQVSQHLVRPLFRLASLQDSQLLFLQVSQLVTHLVSQLVSRQLSQAGSRVVSLLSSHLFVRL